MRLRRLDLQRYGKFADTVLEFGPSDRACDVSVIYGPNEAGKSTAFFAWLDLLYGLPNVTPHAFRFARKDLAIGAELETPQGPLSLVRTGKRTGSLTDAQGHEIAQSRLTSLLHGLDRDAYSTRFSLNDAVLRKGGDDIAKAQGDLGQLLHAGSSGLSGVSERLADIEADIEAFHKKGARKTRLRTAVVTLKELNAAIKAARLSPRDHDALQAARDAAETRRNDATAALDAARRALALREAVDRRRVLAADLAALDDALATLPEGPPLPEDAVAVVVAADTRIFAAERDLAEAEASRQQAEADLGSCADDTVGRGVADVLARLLEARFDDDVSLQTRVEGAEADLDRRRAEIQGLDADMQAVAHRLGQVQARTLVLNATDLDRLRAFAEADRDAAQRLAELEAAFIEAKDQRGDAVSKPDGLDILADALDAMPAPDRLDTARIEAAQAQETLHRATSGLSPAWHDTPLADLPDDTFLLSLEQRIFEAQSAAKEAKARCQEADDALSMARAARDAVVAPLGLRDEDIQRTRADRDEAWRVHGAALSRDTADSFERAMRADDVAREQHARSADTRARLAALEEEVHRQSTLLDLRIAARDKAAQEIAQLDKDRDRVGLRLGLTEGTPVDAFRPQHARLVAAHDAAVSAELASKRADAAAAAYSEALDVLGGALNDAGIDAGAPALRVATAERHLTRLRDQEKAFLSWTAQHGTVEGLALRVSRAQAVATKARGALTECCQGLALPMSPEALFDRLPDLVRLRDLDRQRRDLQRRIDALVDALRRFESLAAPLYAALELGAQTPPTAVLHEARLRAKAAETVTARRDALQAVIAEAVDRKADAERRAAEARRDIALVLKGQDRPGETPPRQAVQELARRDALRTRRAACRADLDAAGQGFDADDLAQEDALSDPARAPHLSDAVAEAAQTRDEAQRALGAAEERLAQALAADGGAAADQRRATLLEELRDEARQAAALTLGLMAARDALRQFREDRRGAMLRATQAAFAHLTRGEWTRLETRTTGRTEQLVAVKGDMAVTADALSTGTRGQLYLALRIAGHADFVDANGPLPFVTDDIHETFDDDRAGAALDLASQMGARGQVLVFTHHRHLVEIARDRVPDLHVVTLPT